MDRSLVWKAVVIGLLALGCVWLLIPTYYSLVVLPREQRNNLAALQERMPGFAPPARYRLNLGLDLQGGIHLVMRVDTRTALQKRVERRAGQLETRLREAKLESSVVPRPEQLQLVVRPADPATLPAVEKEVDRYYGGDMAVADRTGDSISFNLVDTRVMEFQEEALEQAMLIIRRRIDRWGVAEAEIRKRGADAIEISLPGAEDPEQAKQLIGRTAQLEFKLVAQDHGTFFTQLAQQSPLPPGVSLQGDQLEAPTREPLVAYTEGKAPEGKQVLLECLPDAVRAGECRAYRSWLLETRALVTGESLTGAEYWPGEFNEPEVNITFDAQGARDFEQLTGDNRGRFMAIVLDDTVHSAPRINEKIPGGRARITIGRIGEEGVREAQNLALVLKAGALPAPVAIGEVRQVGATLGPELIRKGSLAAVMGLALVVLFMLVYYRTAGVVSDVALLLNALIVLATLSLFNATLTLPGIAGFVLTLGMAVDANVLINERIREELRAGKSMRAAVDQGYDRAFWTIFDANLTSLIAGMVLFFTGTGPIRGFATTLIIGLIASMFTSIVVTRVITTWLVHGRNVKTLSV
jgi:preprotein translocase subunit SecD